ncbi:hypothetical protein HDU76_000502 [Blyttiomyces sp. JEL0837]|nr:hypothetical protein HDU76_000502 [Blyttiomyces sp. JEL0837]
MPLDLCDSEECDILVIGISKVQGVTMAIAALMASVSDNMCLIESGLFTGISNTTSSFHHVVPFMDTVGLEGTNASVFDRAVQHGMPFDNTTNYWDYGNLDFGFNNVKSFHNRFNLSSNSTASSGLDSTHTTTTTMLPNIIQNSTTTTNNNATRLGIIHFVTEVGLPGWLIVRKKSVRVLNNNNNTLGNVDITTIKRKIIVIYDVGEHGLPAWKIIHDRKNRSVREIGDVDKDENIDVDVVLNQREIDTEIDFPDIASPNHGSSFEVLGLWTILLGIFVRWCLWAIKLIQDRFTCGNASIKNDTIVTSDPPDTCDCPAKATIPVSSVSSTSVSQSHDDGNVVDDGESTSKDSAEFVPGKPHRRYDPTHPCCSFPCAFTFNNRKFSNRSTPPTPRECLSALSQMVKQKSFEDFDDEVVVETERSCRKCTCCLDAIGCGRKGILVCTMMKGIMKALYGQGSKS